MTATVELSIRELDEQVAACLRQGRFAQALPLAAHACEEVRARAGEGSAELAGSLSRLAEAYRELGQLSEAEPYCLQALNIQAAVGKDRPEYAASLNELGRLYEAMGNNRHAAALYQGRWRFACACWAKGTQTAPRA